MKNQSKLVLAAFLLSATPGMLTARTIASQMPETNLQPAKKVVKKKAAFLPPTMGWSTWNTFALNINENVIKQQADAMVKTGLKAAGYEYINIDDGYWNGRDADGTLRINKEKFPNGMKVVADYIHSKGLKAGIYSDAGDNTCGSGNKHPWGLGVGLAGHEEADCKTYFIDWDYDFIKIDYCGGAHMGLDEQAQYTKIGNAIKHCEQMKGKDIVFNICRWAYPGNWARNVADSWRTTGDINGHWDNLKGIVKENLYIQAYTYGGHYNDMDMLEIGRTLNPDEENLHMAYWCIASSPLLVGCDMTKMSDHSLNLMKNRDLIAMDQDHLGIGAPVVYRDGEVYVVAKDITQVHGTKRAVVVMNLSDNAQTISFPLSAVEFTGKVKVHDCLTQKDKGFAQKNFTTTVPAHGATAFYMTGARIEPKTYEAETAWLSKYQEIKNLPTARPMEADNASQGVCVGYLGNDADNYMEWRNVWSNNGGTYKMSIRYASAENRNLSVKVNGKEVTSFSNLNSGDYTKDWKTVTVNVKLHKGMNKVELGSANGFAPNIDKMTLQKM